MILNKKNYIAAAVLAACAVISLTACGSSGSSSSQSTQQAQTTAALTEAAAQSAGSASDAASVGAESKAADQKAADGTEAASGGNGELVEMDVVLDWYPNAIHSFLYEAIDNGYFAEEGLKVNLITPASGVDSITFAATGKAAIGLTYPINTIQAKVNEDMPVAAIGAVTQVSLGRLAALAETDITDDMATLKGKKVGYAGTGAAEAMINTIIKNAGLEKSDCELIDVGFDLTTSLTTKSVDLVIGTFINDEIVTMRNAGYDVNVWEYQDYGIPQTYGLIMVANTDDYNANPEIYKGFLRACAKGFKDMKADEEQVIGMIMSEMNTDDNPLDEKQQRESYEILIPYMENADAEFLSMNDEVWQANIDWMYESGLISKTADAKDIYIAPEL